MDEQTRSSPNSMSSVGGMTPQKTRNETKPLTKHGGEHPRWPSLACRVTVICVVSTSLVLSACRDQLIVAPDSERANSSISGGAGAELVDRVRELISFHGIVPLETLPVRESPQPSRPAVGIRQDPERQPRHRMYDLSSSRVRYHRCPPPLYRAGRHRARARSRTPGRCIHSAALSTAIQSPCARRSVLGRSSVCRRHR